MVFQHVPYEPLGTLDPLIRSLRHRIKYVNFGREPLAEPSIQGYDALIILGGPMNIGNEANYPHLLTEQSVIRDAMQRDMPILGICLGSQLIAAANGADVYPAKADEIGWATVTQTASGKNDPLIASFTNTEQIFQWHSYTFDLPNQAELLLSGDICVNQAYRMQEKVYGMQFHLEASSALIERWLKLPAHLAELGATAEQAQANIEHIRNITALQISNSNKLSEKAFGSFLDLLPEVRGHGVFPHR